MKKLALIAAVSLMASSFAYGQGTVYFNTRVVADDVVVQVFMPDGVTPLEGTGYTAQLFGGAVGTAANALTPLVPTTGFRTGAGAGFTVTVGTGIPVPGVPEGGTATIQMRVWENAGGTITSYADALSAGVMYGESNLIDVAGLGGILTTPPSLVGLQSFNLVPEPTTYALLALGAGALLFRRRKTA